MCASIIAVAAPAAAQVTRVSVSTAGTQGNDYSDGGVSISGDGRYVVFTSWATSLVAGDTQHVRNIFLRDRDTDADGIFDEPGAVATTRITAGPNGVAGDAESSRPVITPDGRYVVFESLATNLLPGAIPAVRQIYRFDRMAGTTVRVSESAAGAAANADCYAPVISDSGDVVSFSSQATNLVDPQPGFIGPFVREISADRTRRVFALPPSRIDPSSFYFVAWPSLSADGTKLAFVLQETPLRSSRVQNWASVVDLATGALTPLPERSTRAVTLDRTGTVAMIEYFEDAHLWTARHVIATGAETAMFWTGVPSPAGRYVMAEGDAPNRLVDLELGTTTTFPFDPITFSFDDAAFSVDERWLVLSTFDRTLVAGDTNDATDVFVIDLPDLLDADDDTMDDRWETLFGVTDPNADPDGDGQTNAQEEDAGTHPNGQISRLLAEGVTGGFFDTTIHLANPDPTHAAGAVVTFDTGAGTRVRRTVGVPAGYSVQIDVGAVRGLESTDVSTTVESDRFLAVEREIVWGTGEMGRYGSHAERAAPGPSPTWFLAEGSTVLDFNLFYLLQNPQATTTQATVRFLLPSGATVTRTYDLRPRSRTTIYVNDIPGLEETDVAGDISADAPIVVERAMYRNLPGQPFGLGHDAMGVTAPAASWFLAEGATGAFFDLYVLIANPGDSAATVRADFARPDGSVVTQTYTVRAHSRHSIYVDAIPGLEATSVATTLTSTNAVPIVAERAMYWPGGFFDYYEGHASAGATTTALNWVVAGGEKGGPDDAQTYVLIANTDTRPGQARITLLADVTTTYGIPGSTYVTLPPTSRTTVPLEGVRKFGALVESIGPSPVQLVVESAMYRNAGGVMWSAGSNALATPVP